LFLEMLWHGRTRAHDLLVAWEWLWEFMSRPDNAMFVPEIGGWASLIGYQGYS
jgi:hypothetical protein